MAETTIMRKDASTSNILKPRQAMIINAVPGNVYSYTFPAWLQRYRLRIQAPNQPMDYSFDPLFAVWETIPGNLCILEEVIYRTQPLTIFFRSLAGGNTNFQITFWVGA